MKKIVLLSMLLAVAMLFSGCGEQLVMNFIEEYGGEEAVELFKEVKEQNQKEIEAFDKEWDSMKDELLEETKKEIREEIDKNYDGENSETVKEAADAGTEVGFGIADKILDALTGGLQYPLQGEIKNTDFSSSTNGILCDFKAVAGTPLYAPGNGTVKYIQVYGKVGGVYKLVSYGNQVLFTSDPIDGKIYTVLMGHLNAFNIDESLNLDILPSSQTAKVSTSPSSQWYNAEAAASRQAPVLLEKEVRKGELLGYTGETGNAHGPHLHMEVKENGVAVEPTEVLASWN